MEFDNSVSHTVLALLLASSNEKSLETCEKDVRKLSKVNKKLYQVASVQRAAL